MVKRSTRLPELHWETFLRLSRTSDSSAPRCQSASEKRESSNWRIARPRQPSRRHHRFVHELAKLAAVGIPGDSGTVNPPRNHPRPWLNPNELALFDWNFRDDAAGKGKVLRISYSSAEWLDIFHLVRTGLRGAAHGQLVVRSPYRTGAGALRPDRRNVIDAGHTSQDGKRTTRSQCKPSTRTSWVHGVALRNSDSGFDLYCARGIRGNVGITLPTRQVRFYCRVESRILRCLRQQFKRSLQTNVCR